MSHHRFHHHHHNFRLPVPDALSIAKFASDKHDWENAKHLYLSLRQSLRAKLTTHAQLDRDYQHARPWAAGFRGAAAGAAMSARHALQCFQLLVICRVAIGEMYREARGLLGRLERRKGVLEGRLRGWDGTVARRYAPGSLPEGFGVGHEARLWAEWDKTKGQRELEDWWGRHGRELEREDRMRRER